MTILQIYVFISSLYFVLWLGYSLFLDDSVCTNKRTITDRILDIGFYLSIAGIITGVVGFILN
jgi:hypothetical protein